MDVIKAYRVWYLYYKGIFIHAYATKREAVEEKLRLEREVLNVTAFNRVQIQEVS